jgi:hypothetical protein
VEITTALRFRFSRFFFKEKDFSVEMFSQNAKIVRQNESWFVYRFEKPKTFFLILQWKIIWRPPKCNISTWYANKNSLDFKWKTDLLVRNLVSFAKILCFQRKMRRIRIPNSIFFHRSDWELIFKTCAWCVQMLSFFRKEENVRWQK